MAGPRIPPELGSKVSTRDIQWDQLVIRQWGQAWARPDKAYRMSNGREFDCTDMTTGGIYNRVPPNPCQPPSPPENLVITYNAIGPTLQLVWGFGDYNASTQISRRTSPSGVYSLLATVTGRSYIDSAVTDGQDYTYYLIGLNECSDASVAGATVMIHAPPGPVSNQLQPPGNVDSTCDDNGVNLTWTPGLFSSSTNVYRSDNGGAFTVLANATGGAYTDSTVLEGHSYQYKLKGVNAGLESSFSSTTTEVFPAGSVISVASGGGVLTVTLNNTSAYNTTVQVRRGTNVAGPFSLLATISASTTSYPDSTASPGTTYYYTTVGVNTCGSSSIGNVYSARINTDLVTWNPADKSVNCSLSVDLLTADSFAGGLTDEGGVRATFYRSSGIRQVEVLVTAITAVGPVFGFSKSTAPVISDPGFTVNGWGYYAVTGDKLTGGSSAAYGSAYTVGDYISGVFNFSTGTITFYKNGISQGVAFTLGAGLTVAPHWAHGSSTLGHSACRANFGATAFQFPIAGAIAWDVEN